MSILVGRALKLPSALNQSIWSHITHCKNCCKSYLLFIRTPSKQKSLVVLNFLNQLWCLFLSPLFHRCWIFRAFFPCDTSTFPPLWIPFYRFHKKLFASSSSCSSERSWRVDSGCVGQKTSWDKYRIKMILDPESKTKNEYRCIFTTDI